MSKIQRFTKVHYIYMKFNVSLAFLASKVNSGGALAQALSIIIDMCTNN